MLRAFEYEPIQIACTPTPHHSPMFNGNLLTTPQPQSADCNLSIANHLPVKAGKKTPGACGFLYGLVSRFQFSVGPSGLSATYLRMCGLGHNSRWLGLEVSTFACSCEAS